jgi:plasmid stabilization system protein ParE
MKNGQMSRAIRKAQDFTADFESLFGWYVDKAGVDVAWRFQGALDSSLVKLSVRPDLDRPGTSIIRNYGDYAPFWWSNLSRIF